MNDQCATCFADAKANGSRRAESWCLALTDTDFGDRECPFYKRAGTTATMEQREAAGKIYAKNKGEKI